MASTVTCEFVLIGTEKERQAGRQPLHMKSHFVITNEQTAMIAGKSHLNPSEFIVQTAERHLVVRHSFAQRRHKAIRKECLFVCVIVIQRENAVYFHKNPCYSLNAFAVNSTPYSIHSECQNCVVVVHYDVVVKSRGHGNSQMNDQLAHFAGIYSHSYTLHTLRSVC